MSRHNIALEAIAEQQEFFGLGGESFYNVDNNNQPFSTLRMVEMDMIALQIKETQDLDDKTDERPLEVVGTSKGLFLNKELSKHNNVENEK